MFNLPEGLSRADRIHMGLEEDHDEEREEAMLDYYDNLRKDEAIERAFSEEKKEIYENN